MLVYIYVEIHQGARMHAQWDCVALIQSCCALETLQKLYKELFKQIICFFIFSSCRFQYIWLTSACLICAQSPSVWHDYSLIDTSWTSCYPQVGKLLLSVLLGRNCFWNLLLCTSWLSLLFVALRKMSTLPEFILLPQRWDSFFFLCLHWKWKSIWVNSHMNLWVEIPIEWQRYWFIFWRFSSFHLSVF